MARLPTPATLLPALAVSTVLAFGTVSAHADPAPAAPPQDSEMQHGADRDHRGPPTMDRPDHDRHFADDLNLTDSQRTAFRNALRQMGDVFHRGRDLHEALHDLTQSDDYSEAKVRELLRKHEADSENDLVAATKAMHDFYMSLSPDQKKRFNEMHERMRQRMEERRHDFRHGDHDGMMGMD